LINTHKQGKGKTMTKNSLRYIATMFFFAFALVSGSQSFSAEAEDDPMIRGQISG
jgi:hypothetical protein